MGIEGAGGLVLHLLRILFGICLEVHAVHATDQWSQEAWLMQGTSSAPVHMRVKKNGKETFSLTFLHGILKSKRTEKVIKTVGTPEQGVWAPTKERKKKLKLM